MYGETPLERMLRDAWREPGLRPAFYKRLLISEVLVPVQAPPEQVLDGVIAAGAKLDMITLVRSDNTVAVPFYTSPERLYEGSPTGERCVVMTVRELFESRHDLHFHINPFSTFGREFTPWEVRSLLDTAGIATVERTWAPHTEEAHLRAPRELPEVVLQALRVLFARNFEIRAAYVAERYGPGAEEKGALLIALDLAEGANHVRALREAGTVITESWLSGMPTFGVVVLPRDGSAVSRYFLEQATPFFTIGLTGSIASVLRGVQAGM